MPTIQLPTSPLDAKPPTDRNLLLHIAIRSVAVAAILVLAGVWYHQTHPAAVPPYVQAYCSDTGPAGLQVEADLTAHAGHNMTLTAVGATTGTTRTATKPDDLGWLVTAALPQADRAATITVRVDGKVVATDTQTEPKGCVRK